MSAKEHPLKEKLRTVVAQVDQMSTRERVMMLAILALLFIAVWYFMVLLPFEKGMAQAAKDEASLATEIQQAQEIEQMLRDKKTVDPNADNRQRLEKAEKALREMDGRLGAATQNLVDSAEITRFLRRMLARQPALQLYRLESQPSRILGKSSADAEAEKEKAKKKKKRNRDEEAAVYLHDWKLEMKGDFFSLLQFLRSLEQSQWMVFWDGMSFSVQSHPDAWIVLNLYTLSLEEELLGAE